MTDQIRQILTQSAGISAESLPIDADLYQAGLKSLATVRVMMALESTFQVEFSSELWDATRLPLLVGSSRSCAS